MMITAGVIRKNPNVLELIMPPSARRYRASETSASLTSSACR
jgi:hypothetical protein